jgi:hypothetical protein
MLELVDTFEMHHETSYSQQDLVTQSAFHQALTSIELWHLSSSETLPCL